jgi:hypothetical protein
LHKRRQESARGLLEKPLGKADGVAVRLHDVSMTSAKEMYEFLWFAMGLLALSPVAGPLCRNAASLLGVAPLAPWLLQCLAAFAACLRISHATLGGLPLRTSDRNAVNDLSAVRVCNFQCTDTRVARWKLRASRACSILAVAIVLLPTLLHSSACLVDTAWRSVTNLVGHVSQSGCV